jgi:4,5:9,10-diseco-3-hydroxy-5,9,17-trioxoandrosta-1(10),2-diene-4-oate hydrolase
MQGDPGASTPTTRKVAVGAHSISLREMGAGFPVLMLHGGGPGASGASNYSRNTEALAQHFRVLVPDLPGYGQSSKAVSRQDPFGDIAGAMLGLLDALGIGVAHVIGNSLGGAVSLRMALEAPARVTSMVLMGPGGVETSRRLPTKGLRQLLDYYKGDGPSFEKLDNFIRQSLVYDGSRIPQDLVRDRFKASIDPEIVAAPPLRRPRGLAGLRALDITRDPRLSACKTPTLVLWGTQDRVNRPSGARALQTRMENCDVYLFSKTGHWVQWERAPEFNACVSGFLLAREAARHLATDPTFTSFGETATHG